MINASHVTFLDHKNKERIAMDVIEFKKWEPDGRRIYVHQLSFTTLAQQSPDSALLVFNSLGQMIVEKITHHHLEQAVEFKLVNPVRGLNVVNKLRKHYSPLLTSTLRMIGYRPIEPVRHRDFYPLLGSSEYVYDTCAEAGYFLFATGIEATRRMFEEKGSMHQERVAIREGLGPTDITWINGRNLAFLRSDLPLGPGAAKFYFAPESRNNRMDVDEFATLKQQVARRILTELEITLFSDGSNYSHEESEIFERLFATCRVALTKGIFGNQ